MRIDLPTQTKREALGFTMVEIAIAVAVIAFALVAIIGVLPAGLQVQKENREDTLLAQDGMYFMEAIRSGAVGLDELPYYVSRIDVVRSGVTNSYSSFGSGAEVIGLLSTPGFDTTNFATVRAISGALAEKGPATAEVAFRYQMQVHIEPFQPLQVPIIATNVEDIRIQDRLRTELQDNLQEIRLRFLWPILPRGGFGSSRQTLRSIASGQFVVKTNGNTPYFYLRP
jgi:type II secretory pathway pseudopilin PulG